MDLGQFLFGGALLILFGGGWFFERAFSRHQKRVEDLLTSIDDTLEKMKEQADPLRPQRIQKTLQNLRTQLPAVADRIDDAFAAEVLNMKHQVGRLYLIRQRAGLSPEFNQQQIPIEQKMFAEGLAKDASLKGVPEADAQKAIFKVLASVSP
jgi:hypothetical protein